MAVDRFLLSLHMLRGAAELNWHSAKVLPLLMSCALDANTIGLRMVQVGNTRRSTRCPIRAEAWRWAADLSSDDIFQDIRMAVVVQVEPAYF